MSHAVKRLEMVMLSAFKMDMETIGFYKDTVSLWIFLDGLPACQLQNE
ncbi:MAG: hypothetical protein Q9M20_06240 [Mariprofundaceae bacterium]|nr:hypothetical protein [Mariprofundaceae bacterium]